MRFFVETLEYPIGLASLEPEVGDKRRITITSAVVKHKDRKLELPLAAQIRDFTGADPDWQSINLATALLMISAD